MDSRFNSCYQDWLSQQGSDLDELIQALPNTTATDDHLRSLVYKIILHYEEYSARRCLLLPEVPPEFVCPFWCSSLENSFLWIGGCRPTMSIRLVGARSSAQLDAHLEGFLRDGASIGGSGGMIELTGQQLEQINDLHERTLRDEMTLTSRMEILQEEVAGKPLVGMVTDLGGRRRADESVKGNVKGVKEEYAHKLGKLLEEADELRIKTVKELVMEILIPRQAVELLAAGKQLHLSIHAWGKNRDGERGQQDV